MNYVIEYAGYAIGFLAVCSFIFENPRHSIYSFTAIMVLLFIIVMYRYENNIINSTTAFWQMVLIIVSSTINYKFKSYEIAEIERKKRTIYHY